MMRNISLNDIELRLRQRERELQAVLNVTHAMQSHVNLDELIDIAVLTAMATVNADAGSLLLHDNKRNKLVFRFVAGPSKILLTGMDIDDERGIAGEVLHTGVARISPDVTTEKNYLPDIDDATHYKTKSMITVPLQAGTESTPIGVLQILNKREDDFDQDDLAVLEILATQVAAAIINAQLNEKARAATIVDLMGEISHDIKNLLTPVSMSGQTLRMMMDQFVDSVNDVFNSPPDEKLIHLPEIELMIKKIYDDACLILDILDESANIAQQRTKEIADCMKGITAQLSLASTDLNELVTSVCRVLQVVGDQNGVDVSYRRCDMPFVSIDSHRMYNAIYNLVNNAISATPSGGSVLVTPLYQPENNIFAIQVRDTGQGMSQEKADLLFTGKVRSTKPGGTGLGTTVVKNVIDAHKGILAVESQEGEGTIITAKIPLKAGHKWK
jgi:signal transduction histidine kinase